MERVEMSIDLFFTYITSTYCVFKYIKYLICKIDCIHKNILYLILTFFNRVYLIVIILLYK